MVHIFCNERGAGKTKKLIELANNRIKETKGDSVYIDDDNKYMKQIDRRIRFVATKDLNIFDNESLYGLLCGIIAGNYDIENVYIDGFFNTINKNENLLGLFKRINELSEKYNLSVYINVNLAKDNIPEFKLS